MTLSHSLYTTQNFTEAHPSDIDSNEPFFTYQIQGQGEQTIASSTTAKEMMYSDLPLTLTSWPNSDVD